MSERPARYKTGNEDSLEDIVNRLDVDVALLKSSHLSLSADMEIVKQSLRNLEKGVEALSF